MVDQVRVLLANPSDVPGYVHVVDPVSDAVMDIFGGNVDLFLPFALAPDLSRFRRFYDSRTTPVRPSSVYRQPADSLSVPGVYDRVLGGDGWWKVSAVFQHADPGVAVVLSEMRDAAMSGDAVYALGAVLLAVAYRRWLLQGRG